MRILKYALSILYLKLFALLHNCFVAIKGILLKLKSRAENTVVKENVTEESFIIRTKRTCHFHELFITHKGEIFPCCMTCWRRDMKIGHIHDDNLIESLRNFYSPCSCARFQLRKGLPEKKITVDYINIEVSLLCQGKCALCGVNAPSWQGQYDYYDALNHLLDTLQPRQILVQGGEVLIQSETLDWIGQLRQRFPNLKITISTNGNRDLEMIDRVEELFSGVNISFIGFQPATYEVAMGMEVAKAVRFAEELAKRGKVRLVLKLLTTPLTLHEFGIFLEWAIPLKPAEILVDDANTLQYIRMETYDNFWEKIFTRTREKLRAVLIKNRDILSVSGTVFGFSDKSIKILGLESGWEDFLAETGIKEKTYVY